MGIGRKLVKGIGRKLGTTMMDKVGRKLVHTLGDTSSDAPDAAFKPKRNLYEQMKAGEVDETGAAHAHDHDHDHDG